MSDVADTGTGAPLERIRETAARLRAIADELRDPAVGDQQAADLAREAAEAVSAAGNEIDRALREAESENE